MGYKKAVDNAKSGNSRSQENAQQAASNLSGQFDQITDKLAENIVDYVGASALQKAFNRLGSGDIGKVAPRMIENFERGLLSPFEESITQLQEWEDSPLFVLPSSEELVT